MGAASTLGASEGISAAGAGVSAISSIQTGKAQSSYYSYLSGIATENAALATAEGKAQAQQLGVEGFYKEGNIARSVNSTIGAQKAALASGAGVSSRTAQSLIDDTLTKGNLETTALNLNTALRTKSALLGAQIQGFNYQAQGVGYGMAGANAMRSANIGAYSTLLGGAGQIANLQYMSTLRGGYGYGTAGSGITPTYQPGT
jgi:hypothetical protein